MKGCTDFEYAGEMLSDYGMMLCSFDSGGGIETVSSGADVTFNQIKPIGSNRSMSSFTALVALNWSGVSSYMNEASSSCCIYESDENANPRSFNRSA